MNWVKGQLVDKGRYEIIDRIGTGEFGAIYKAIYLPHSRSTIARMASAIKTESTHRKSGNLKYKFIEVTIETIDEIHHHEISFDRLQTTLITFSGSSYLNGATVFSENKIWGVVIENHEGENLEDRIRDRGRLTENQAVEIIQKIGSAINYCYSQRLLYRNIKPANIIIQSSIIESSEEPILIDFDLREIIDTITNSTENNCDLLNSPQVQKRSEFQYIYALASTLYSCVTGSLPPSLEMRLVQDSLLPPQELNPDLSDRINQTILKGMSMELEDRTSTLQEWLSLMPRLKVKEENIVWKFRRGQRIFYDLDMSNLQLSNTLLGSIQLVNINCTDSKFKEANFSGSKFDRVDFSNSVFRNAILSKACFSQVNLQNADLRGAHLDDADFNDTNLQGANLCGANLRGAKISAEQLKQAKANFLTIFPNGKRGGWW
jgi:serine/threonine protein kinase